MTIRPLFAALGVLCFLGIGCSETGDFTYSNGSEQLPPPVLAEPERAAPTGPMELRSPAFQEGQPIPEIYTCNGSDYSPAMEFVNIPEEASGLAIIAEDVDAPGGFIHWVVFNMPWDTTGIGEGEPPNGAVGLGSGERQGYEGPCPPNGQHRYRFTLYAVRGVVEAEEGATAEQVRAAMEGQIVATATLTGTYGK